MQTDGAQVRGNRDGDGPGSGYPRTDSVHDTTVSREGEGLEIKDQSRNRVGRSLIISSDFSGRYDIKVYPNHLSLHGKVSFY